MSLFRDSEQSRGASLSYCIAGYQTRSGGGRAATQKCFEAATEPSRTPGIHFALNLSNSNLLGKGETMELSRDRFETQGLLYPLLVIAAIAVIVFSIVGIATISGWMPTALANAVPPADYTDTARTGATFECVECGVVESLREIQRRDDSGTRADIVAAVAH